nr:hypothetical protein [Tanacetum cinerariifolium]
MDIDEGIELVDDQEKNVQVKRRQADTQAEIYNIDLDHTSKVIPAAEPVVAPVSTPISAVKPKVLKYIRRYHGYKKKPQSKSEARKNMIAYLKNTEGFNMAFFKGKTYDQIRPIFQA